MKTIGYLVLAFLIIGCKNSTCPAYPEEFLNWMPYNKGENRICIAESIGIIQMKGLKGQKTWSLVDK